MDPDLALFLHCAELRAQHPDGRHSPAGRAVLALAFHRPGWSARLLGELAMASGYAPVFAQAAQDGAHAVFGSCGHLDAVAWNGSLFGSASRSSLLVPMEAPPPRALAESFALAMLRSALALTSWMGEPLLASCEALAPGESSDGSDACRAAMAGLPPPPCALAMVARASRGALEREIRAAQGALRGPARL